MSPPLVELRGVGFAYPASGTGQARPFRLADLTFEIGTGEIVGVLGPNSAGKTTLIRLLTRVLAPDAGGILLEGRPLPHWRPAELARRVAVVPQGVPPEFPFTVEELVLMGRYPHAPERYFESPADRESARAAMQATSVLELAEEPRLLVLDEPTAHLDLRYQAETAALLRRLNRERGVTILLVSHDLNLAAEVCDRLLLLAAGRQVAVGAPEAVLSETLLAAAFGCEVTVEKHPATRRPVVQPTWRVDGPRPGCLDTPTTKGGCERSRASE